MKNEYVIYWRRDTMYRTKVVAESEDEAISRVCNGFSTDSSYSEEIDEYGDMSIDNIECIQEGVQDD
jgi:hypothetical protein